MFELHRCTSSPPVYKNHFGVILPVLISVESTFVFGNSRAVEVVGLLSNKWRVNNVHGGCTLDVLTDCPSFANDKANHVIEQCQEQGLQIKVLKRSCVGASNNGNLGLDQQEDEPANFTSLASLLRSCGKANALCDGRSLHTYINRRGYDQNTFLGNCLLQMYGNCGSVEDAQATFENLRNPDLYSWNILIKAHGQNGNLMGAQNVFARMPWHDAVSWTALIAAFTQNGHGKKALEIFHQMQSECARPTNVTFVCVLEACANMQALEKGQEIHGVIVISGYGRDLKVGNALVSMYGKCGSIADARVVFNGLPHRDVVSWTAMIAALVKNGHSKAALDFLHGMLSEGIKPDRITFVCLLDACANLSALDKGKGIHATIADIGYELDVVVGTALVNMYGKCGSLWAARRVFDRMPHRDVICWNAMIAALAQNGQSREALNVLHTMEFEGAKPNRVSYVSSLDACASMADLENGQEMHARIVYMGYEEHVVVGTSLVNMYGKCGCLIDARTVFDKMPHWDVTSWNAIIAACAQSELGKEALDLFNQMNCQCVKPDNITFVCVLDACACIAALKAGQETHAAILHSEYGQDVAVSNGLINMYGKCGSVPDAIAVFRRVSSQDVVSWTSLIAAYSQNGHGREALDLFHQMQLEGVNPNDITFICVLSACSHTGLVDEGREFFVSMERDHGIAYTLDHYICMVDLLGRAGHLEEAEGLIRDMPFRKAALAWLCLLGACRVHGDVERGGAAADQCFKLDPKNPASYVILSNLYLESGRLDDVAKLREAMKRNAVQVPDIDGG